MFDDPLGVDAHVVGDHVAGESDAEVSGAVAEGGVGAAAAEVLGDGVVAEGIGGGDGVGLSAQALDGARGDAALPESDEPEGVDAALGEQLQLFVGDLVEALDVAEIFLGKLFEPDVGAFGEEDDVGHPGLIGAEGFVFVERGLVVGGVASDALSIGTEGEFTLPVLVEADVLVTAKAVVGAAWLGVPMLIRCGRMELQPDGDLFFADGGDGEQELAQTLSCAGAAVEQGRPALADEFKLSGDGVWRGEHGGGERAIERTDLGVERRT